MSEAGALDRAETNGALLALVGRRVREVRALRGLSRKALSEGSGVSPRFIAQLESGEGNISIARLKEIADALRVSVADLVDGAPAAAGESAELARLYARASPDQRRAALAALRPDGGRARRIALIGLRGAGKSTLGRRAAAALGMPFVELNAEIEAIAGLAAGEIFSLYGEEGYRALERRALDAVADRHGCVILAVGGGIVASEATFEALLSRFTAIWLRASPKEHMARVIAQGDRRPMAGNPAAMEQLKAILESRERLYACAPRVLDTSGRAVEASAAALVALVEECLAAESADSG